MPAATPPQPAQSLKPVTYSEYPRYPKLEELIATLHRLRAPGGCVWDSEQTHETLVQYLIEETHELIEAIETGTRDDLIEELGDVLYQVIFHADLASETDGEKFTLEDVAERMTAKMISRHPHVFGDQAAQAALNIQSGADVVAVWDELKKADKPNRTSVLDGIPQGMPSLALATKLLGRARKVGVPIAALPETQREHDAQKDDAQMHDAQKPDAQKHLTDEAHLGVFLLATVASAAANGLDAERALRTALRSLQANIREAEITD
jgi:XTP/dITP diphosphohydrolase